jgi:hypothetical protein
MMLVRKAALSGLSRRHAFRSAPCVRVPSCQGPRLLIKHPDVATRPDGVEDFRSPKCSFQFVSPARYYWFVSHCILITVHQFSPTLVRGQKVGLPSIGLTAASPAVQFPETPFFDLDRIFGWGKWHHYIQDIQVASLY